MSDPANPTVAVYTGRGTGDPTREGIQAFLDRTEFAWHGIDADAVATIDLDAFDAFYVPGGWAWPYVHDIPPAGKRALRAFVEAGGAYLGVCAGAYFAADLIEWEGRLVEYDLDLYRGVARGPIDAIEPWRGWRLTELELSEHEIHAGETRHEALYWGGPAFELHAEQPTTVLARYAVTGDPAAVTFALGRGQVLLMGCHLELGLGPDGFDLAGAHGAQWGWLERALRWTLARSRERRALPR